MHYLQKAHLSSDTKLIDLADINIYDAYIRMNHNGYRKIATFFRISYFYLQEVLLHNRPINLHNRKAEKTGSFFNFIKFGCASVVQVVKRKS